MEQRRTRRFTLQLPVSITRNGAERVTHYGLTKNISSGGVLFTAEQEPEVGVSIEYIITLAGATDQSVSLRCIGKVVRAHPANSGTSSYEIAATLERYEFIRPEE
ncbi:MAG: PilZ domain-containing protein [Bryobacteraceae bacterium]